MAGPFRRKSSSVCWFRKRSPTNVLETARGQAVVFSVGPGRDVVDIGPKPVEIVRSLQTHDQTEACQRFTEVSAALDKHWNALRNGPGPCSPGILALSGEVYAKWKALFEDNPVSADLWKREAEVCKSILAHGAKEPPKQFGVIIPQIRNQTGEERFGFLANEVLAKHSQTLTWEHRARLISEVVKAIGEAAELPERTALLGTSASRSRLRRLRSKPSSPTAIARRNFIIDLEPTSR